MSRAFPRVWPRTRTSCASYDSRAVSLRTPLCDVLHIEVPILLAPMAAGPSTPELAAAVTRAGGLGVLGVMGLTTEAVGDQVRRARELCDDGPIGVNVQLARRSE